MAATRLLDLLSDSAHGRFAAVEDQLLVLRPPPGPAMAIVGLPGQHIIASSAPPDWIRDQLRAADLMAPMSPRFIAALSTRIRRSDDGVDVLLAAPALPGTSQLTEVDPSDHPRTARSLAHRDDVRTFTDPSGTATVSLGRGLGRRLEVAVEVSPQARNQGAGSRAFYQARRLIDLPDVLFAQTAPANATSIRALLRAGYAPIGAEVLFFAGPRATN